MTADQRVLGVITARGGSKGLPGKNVADLGGKPLIAWSVEAALGARELDRVVVSSDDPEILEAARDAGGDTPFVRPAELATDDVEIEKVLFHALDQLSEPYDWIVLLQATSPLRTADDIDAGVRKCRDRGAPALVAVCESPKSPHWMHELTEDDVLAPAMPKAMCASHRQMLPPVYVANGALYVAQVPWLREARAFYSETTIAYVMPRERSVDIDSTLDLALARAIVAEKPAAQ